MQAKERLIHHEVPGGLWEVVGMDMVSIYNKTYLCIVDYHRVPNNQEDRRPISRQSNTSM